MRIYKLLLIVLILLFIWYYIKPKKHNFWDKQMVNRDNINNNKIIEDIKKINIDKKLINESWKSVKIKKLEKFINKNFSDEQIYQKKYFNWILASPHRHIDNLENVDRNSFNVCLIKDNNIIGSITGRPIILSIKNNIKKALYVDLLCVDKKKRNKRLAPKLISKMIEIMKINNIEIAIFNIDKKQLPFNHIGCIQYYYDNLLNLNLDKQNLMDNDLKIEELNMNNCTNAYEFYYSIKRKNKLYQLLSFEEFIYYYKPNDDLIETYICYDENKKIIGFASFMVTYYKYNKEVLKNIELIKYFYKSNNYIFFDKLMKKFIDKGFRYIITPNNYTYKNIINKYNLFKCQKTYYYFYNYNLKLKEEDICLNFP